MKISSSNRMEDCVHLVCELLGIQEDDEVGMEMICSLYTNIFLISTNLEDTKRAVSQVRGENGGSCLARSVLHVLLVMERQRETREELYWDLQMLKAGRIDCTLKHNTQSPTISYRPKLKDTEQFNILCLQNKAKRLYVRLVLDGVWTLLPSSSHSKVNMKQGSMCLNSEDVLQLLRYKYDIIKERLYREMLQDEYGMVWWDSMSPWQQIECVCELGASVEQAYRRRDWLKMCGLPGALRCYRSCSSVDLRGCLKTRDQAWSSQPKEQAWTAIIYLSELESSHQEEKESLTALIHRVEQESLRVIYLSMCVAVRRAERENQSRTALLVARQHWHRWPFMRGSVSQELAGIWLQEHVDPTAGQQQSRKTGSCIQQAVLQLLVLCQEQERNRLVEILHSVSKNDLQGPRSNNVADADDQSCVSRLHQIKVSQQEAQGSNTAPLAPGCSGIDVSWGECAVHLLTQLTQAHEDETWDVLHSLQDLELGGLLSLLHKYETKLHIPAFNNLREVLQSCAPIQSTIQPNMERERAEYLQARSLDSEQGLCTGCGMALDPEDTPYLEILCVRDPRDEAGVMEMRDEERARREKVIESRENNEEISVEKQNSLIALAWSTSAHGHEQTQEVTSAVQEVKPDTRIKHERSANTVQNGVNIPNTTPHEVNLFTHLENKSPVSLQPRAEETQTEIQTQTTQDHPGFIADENQKEDVGDQQHTIQPLTDHQPITTQSTDTTDTSMPPASTQSTDQEQSHTWDAREMETSQQQEQRREEETDERGGEEQQLQRETTMRCLVNIQRRAERRWKRDRDRQLLRVQERLAIVQSRKADEDLLGLTHLTDTLRQEDEQQQKTLVREKLEQMRRERSCILQTRRERNTTGFKELIAPTAQRMAETEERH
ncbi:hypothetical protein IRJ41_009155 [Triplophysa rosa]|uniref:Uncharacterized protein n=1 Tax=Triplophysa rosa TaxID=992332 RepID=A0A9W7TTX1_TRIRA|nr:hypothetical protein IRJ41_009155 [Triplophysa rosa]